MKTKNPASEMINTSKCAEVIPSKMLFNAKLYGQQRVQEARGDSVCEYAMAMLKARHAQSRQRKRRVVVDLHPTELYIRDKTDLDFWICNGPLRNLTFVWNDQTEGHCCGLIMKQVIAGMNTWEFYGLKMKGNRTAFIRALKYVFMNLDLSDDPMSSPDTTMHSANGADSAVVDNLIDLSDLCIASCANPTETGEQPWQIKIPTETTMLPTNPTVVPGTRSVKGISSEGWARFDSPSNRTQSALTTDPWSPKQQLWCNSQCPSIPQISSCVNENTPVGQKTLVASAVPVFPDPRYVPSSPFIANWSTSRIIEGRDIFRTNQPVHEFQSQGLVSVNWGTGYCRNVHQCQ